MRGAEATGEHTGKLRGWLLSAHPYAGVELDDRLSLWGLLSHGGGRMSVAAGSAGGRETDIALIMGAFGGRGVMLSPAESGGVRLAVKTDGFYVVMSSEPVASVPKLSAGVSRVRLVLEGSVDALRTRAGVLLTPTLHVGARYDGGAAETGAGLEVGGGVRYAYPPWGVTLETVGRALLAHQDAGYEEWGVGGSLRWAPLASGRGWSLRMDGSWGSTASAVERLWSEGATRAAGASKPAAPEAVGQLQAELGYGVEVAHGDGVLTPYAGAMLGDNGRPAHYRLGGRLSLCESFSIVLEADRRESDGIDPAHDLRLNVSLRW